MDTTLANTRLIWEEKRRKYFVCAVTKRSGQTIYEFASTRSGGARFDKLVAEAVSRQLNMLGFTTKVVE